MFGHWNPFSELERSEVEVEAVDVVDVLSVL